MLFTSPASATDIRQIESICDRFEAAWQKGQRPRPESFLAQAARPLHETLLRHLVTLDWEYRLKIGEQPRIVEYQERFPLISNQVEAIAREISAANENGSAHPMRLGKYRIVRQVGRGGMGVVYEAIEEPQGRRVAIKLIPGIDLSDPNSRERFWREAHTTARLNHANIVQIFEVGEHDGHLFMALEFVAGPTLSDRLRNAPEPPKQAAALVEKLARAIQHAHDQGVVHRDLKPANVLLAKAQEPDGPTFDPSNTGRLSEFTPKVTDFGLAHRVGASDLTATGDIVGTPGYMAPEQAHGKSKHRLVGPAADVYALGAILYAALTGRAPFHGANALDALEQVRSHDPVPPAKLQPRVQRDLETICLKCLEKDPNQRYASADALAEDLRRYLSGAPILARRASRMERARRWCRRNPAIAAAGVLGVVALMSAAGLAVSQAYTAQLRQQHKLTEAALQEAEFERSRATKNAEQLAKQQELTKAALVDAERFRRQAEQLSVSFGIGRALSLLEQNEIARGMLVLGHLLQIAPPETADLDRVIRTNLAAAQQQLPFTLSAVMEQGGEALSAAFSPDGKTLLTGGRIGGVRRWDAVTGAPLGEPLPHDGEIRSVAYSSDGTVFASAGTDKTARVWDAATSQPIGKPMVHAHWIYMVAISPDGKSVLTGSADGTARLWDLATSEQRGELRPPGWVYAVAFSPDGTRLATGSGSQARIWRADTLEPISELLLHRGEVWSLVFSPDNRTLLTGSDDGSARLWEADTGKPVGLPIMHQGSVRSVGFSRDGKTLWTAGANGSVRMWNAARMTAIGVPVQLQSAVHTVVMNPEQNRIATGSVDGKVRLWKQANVNTGGLTLSHDRLVYCGAFSPDGKIIATGTADNKLRLWSSTTGRQIGDAMLHPNSILRLAFSADGQKIITACSDNTARVWNVADGTECGPVVPHNNHVYAVTFSPNGKLILTGSKDNLVRMCDATTGKLMFEPLQLAGWVHAVSFSPDGLNFLTGCEDGTAQMWDTATGKPIGDPIKHRGPVRVATYNPDGCMFVTGTWDEGMARLWDTETRQPIGPPMAHLDHILTAAFSPDGKTVATGAWDGTARVWDVVTCKRLSPPLVHQRTIRDVAFSPDGKTLLTASFDRTARCWQLPAAVQGTPDEIISLVQGLTGMELDNDGMFRDLDASTWEQRRHLHAEVSSTP